MGHVANNILTCCTCPDGENKYNHPCGCPTAQATFTSVSKLVQMCGYSEFTGGPNNVTASVPPKKYLTRTHTKVRILEDDINHPYCVATDWEYQGMEPCPEIGDDVQVLTRQLIHGTYRGNYARTIEDFEEIRSYSPSSTSCGSESVNLVKDIYDEGEEVYYPPEHEGYDNDCCFVQFGSYCETLSDEVVTVDTTGPYLTSTVVSTTKRSTIRSTLTTRITRGYRAMIRSGCGGYTWETVPAQDLSYNETYEEHVELSDEDTEEAATTRAAEVEGSEVISQYPLRTTSFSYTRIETSYTIKSTSLVAGLRYKGCVLLERRRVYAGTVPSGVPAEELDWHDVEPDIIEEFTANPDGDGVTTIVENQPLPHEHGWAYRIKHPNGWPGSFNQSIRIWPAYADCECPSESEQEA